MSEKAHVPGITPEIQPASFNELCDDAAKFLRLAMEKRDAYVINGILVLKINRNAESYFLGLESDSDFKVGTYDMTYGLRVALCVKDQPPFIKGEWYTFSDDGMRKAVVEAGDQRAITMSVPLDKWKHIPEPDEVNKSEALINEAARYAEALGG
ncbi:hypothetical protein K2Y00_00540 [Patescibacteria group bacterium]|nr:hypothetical protein [Patescibacteria group bacterium]